MAQFRLAGEAGLDPLEPPRALHPHAAARAGPVDDNLVHLGVGEQRLDRAEPEGSLGHPARQFGARCRAEHARLSIDEVADLCLEVGLVGAIARGGVMDQALAQTTGQIVERVTHA